MWRKLFMTHSSLEEFIMHVRCRWRGFCRTSPLAAQVIAEEHILLAQVKFSVKNHRVRPTGLAGTGDLEGALFLEAFGRGVEQFHDAVLIAEVESSIGVSDRRGSGGAFGTDIAAPADLAGEEFDTNGEAVAMALACVKKIAE